MARKRKHAPRTKSGRISRAYRAAACDKGTIELQTKRRAIVGEADPALSSSAVGILYAHEILDREQYDKAVKYRIARCAVFGPPWPSTTLGGDASDEQIEDARDKLAKLERHLSQDQRNVLGAVAVFDVLPNWFFVQNLKLKPLPEDHTERQLLLSGLDAMLERKAQTKVAA